ncbi:hypothetical protein SETIT_8G252400v2 [Setaria italica]|uniref:DUF740 domain-containing protein n=1 Tax=Setaria italica TaxID=4555 RepID=A0A368SBS0_SETIT|nr:UPF0503 protein At3g09070, chloroplastic [Setaria italica]RCV39803.1 hypothetical protein SETIT_8G252400v2 [Setaria italica]
MDPSAVCRLHPGVAVTGFCPACLRDRLAGLQPPSSADLRRCKSFSYARSASALEPQRRSCDLFRHQQPIAAAVPEEQADYQYQYQEEPQAEQEAYCSSRKSFLGRKLQQWRRKNKKEPAAEMPGTQAQRHRPSCDVDGSSWDARSGPVPVLARLPATMLSLPVEEDDDMTMAPPVQRSDGQIPVEEDYYYLDASAAAAPGGTAQTRDYYLDSSSSSRRRRSVDRSATSGRNSFSDANNGGELPASWATTAMNANGNARVSPAIAAERPLYHHHYHHEEQSVLVHHQYDFSGSHQSSQKQPANKKGIRGWSIWGLLHKKSSRKQQPAEAAAGAGDDRYPYPWPELRARGYNGQMLRCNSSISARSSFSGGAAMIGGSGRRSISGVDMRDPRDGHGGGLLSERRTRRDEVLLERTRSSSYSRSGHGLEPATAMGVHHHQLSSRPPNIPRRSSSKHDLSSMHRRSTIGL